MQTAKALQAALKGEISLQREFVSLPESVVLSLLHTQQLLDRLSESFFRGHGMTAAQFNLLMILWDYRGRPLKQTELADLLVVNRASVGEAIARAVKLGWISRSPDPRDGRALSVRISPKGASALRRAKGPYYRLLGKCGDAISTAQWQAALRFLHGFRGFLRGARARITT